MNLTRPNDARSTLGAVLGMVSAMSNSVASVFTTVEDGVSMAHNAVNTAKTKQAIRTDYDLASFEENILIETAAHQSKIKREVADFMNADPKNKELFEKSFQELQLAVANRRNPGQQQSLAA